MLLSTPQKCCGIQQFAYKCRATAFGASFLFPPITLGLSSDGKAGSSREHHTKNTWGVVFDEELGMNLVSL